MINFITDWPGGRNFVALHQRQVVLEELVDPGRFSRP
jgi:hypothetical protein